MPTADDVVRLALTQSGGAYVWGGKAAGNEPNPKAAGHGLDCSGFIAWVTSRLGVPLLGGSWQQLAACRKAGTVIPVSQAERTRGALLWLGPGGSEHIVISRGDGTTIEARGKAYGIGSWSVYRDAWTAGALIPGVDYSAPGSQEVDVTGLPLLSKGSTGQPVRNLQGLLNAHGQRLAVDGDFGPATDSAVRAFQISAHIGVDGAVGVQTWSALLGV